MAYDGFMSYSNAAEGRFALALERRIEADLAMGRHADLIGETEVQIHADPLLEGPRCQLILALYRFRLSGDHEMTAVSAEVVRV